MRDPVAVLQETERFLGLKPMVVTEMFVFDSSKHLYCIQGESCNELWPDTYEVHDEEAFDILVDFFSPSVNELYKLINFKLSWMDKYMV